MSLLITWVEVAEAQQTLGLVLFAKLAVTYLTCTLPIVTEIVTTCLQDMFDRFN